MTRACALALAFGVVAGPSAAAPPRGNWSVADAKKFRRYQLYYVAPATAHLPLTAVERYHSPARPDVLEPPTDEVTFVYGDCEPDYTLEDPSCELPLVIQIRPACGAERLKQPTHRVRGVPARLWSHDHLGVWAGRVFVAIYAESPRRLFRLAHALAPVNRVDAASARTALPPPRNYPENSPACSGR